MFYEIGTCVQISQGWQAGRFVLQHYLQYSIYLPTIRTHDILRIIRLMTKFAQILRNLAPSWNLIRWRNNLIPASHVTPLYNSVHVHSNPLGLSTHVPLFIHGWLLHSVISVSHRMPANPARQRHSKWFNLSTQRAPFWHGWLSHSSKSTSHRVPVTPEGQRQVKYPSPSKQVAFPTHGADWHSSRSTPHLFPS